MNNPLRQLRRDNPFDQAVTGKNSQIGARVSGFGDPNAHNFYDYVHGRNYMISLRGHL